MTNYSIFVVDDQPSETQVLFERLFKDDNRFEYTQAQTPKDFTAAYIPKYDAVLLDINLDDWDIKLSEALNIINNQCPVILVSRYWDKGQTHKRVSDALSEAKSVIFVATLVLNWLDGDSWSAYAESIRFQLSDAIGRSRRQGLLNLHHDTDINILHLSDPQYGDPNSDKWSAYVEDQIARFVLRDLDKEIHFIAITGDIAYSGEIEQYKKAKDKLEKLFLRFFPHRPDWRERILLVPGNHDVNLRLAATDRIKIEFNQNNSKTSLKIKTIKEKNIEFSYRKFALTPFREFAWQLTGDPNWRDSEELNWVNDSFRHLGIRFFLLNSTSSITCDHPNKAGYYQESIDNLASDDVTHDQPFGIAFSHHGPPEAGDASEDVLNDWPETSSFIDNRRIKIFIHGHGHARKVDLFDINKQTINPKNKGQLSSDELLRVMAPTTHLNGNLRSENELRGFNLITLKRKYKKVNSIEVQSYEIENNNFTPSKDSPWEYHL